MQIKEANSFQRKLCKAKQVNAIRYKLLRILGKQCQAKQSQAKFSKAKSSMAKELSSNKNLKHGEVMQSTTKQRGSLQQNLQPDHVPGSLDQEIDMRRFGYFPRAGKQKRLTNLCRALFCSCKTSANQHLTNWQDVGHILFVITANLGCPGALLFFLNC